MLRRVQAAGPVRTARTAWLVKWRADALALAVLALLGTIAFSPWWAAGRQLAPLDILHETYAPWRGADSVVSVHNHFTSDAVTQYLGYRAFAARSFASDGRVGWSELTGGGRPEYANTMAAYADWTMQLHRVLDFWTAWHVGLLAQLLIAAAGMYVLLRSQGIVPVIALTGGIAFAASTSFTHTLYHRWLLGAFAWVPWSAWALLQLQAGKRWARAGAPAFLALAFTGGSLQTSVFVVLAVAGVWLGTLLELQGDRQRLRWTVLVAVSGAAGAALAAAWLLPSTLLYLDGLPLHGARNAPGFPHGILQPLRSALLIPLQAVPTLLGSPRSMDLSKLFHGDLALIAFIGFVPMLIAFRSIFRRETPRSAIVLIAMGLLLPLTPLVGVLYHRVQVVFVFGAAWALAHWWQHAPAVPDRYWRSIIRALGVLVVLWLLASIALVALADRIEPMLQARVASIVEGGGGGAMAGFHAWMQQRTLRIVDELQIWHPRQLVALSGGALGLAAVWLRARHLRRATLVLLSAMTLELGAMAADFLTWSDPARYPAYPVRADITALREQVGDGRVYIASTHEGPAPFFPPNTLAVYGLATYQEYETVHVRGMRHAYGFREDAGILGRMGVTHAVAAPGTPLAAGWVMQARGPRFDTWRNTRAVPRYVAMPVGEVPAAFLDALQAGMPALQVSVLQATSNRRIVVVPPGTGTLRIAENWAEGWRYQVAGGETRNAQAAPDGSLTLIVGAGPAPTTVELWYAPSRQALGRWISLCTALAVLLLLGAGHRRARTLRTASRGQDSGSTRS